MLKELKCKQCGLTMVMNIDTDKSLACPNCGEELDLAISKKLSAISGQQWMVLAIALVLSAMAVIVMIK